MCKVCVHPSSHTDDFHVLCILQWDKKPVSAVASYPHVREVTWTPCTNMTPKMKIPLVTSVEYCWAKIKTFIHAENKRTLLVVMYFDIGGNNRADWMWGFLFRYHVISACLAWTSRVPTENANDRPHFPVDSTKKEIKKIAENIVVRHGLMDMPWWGNTVTEGCFSLFVLLNYPVDIATSKRGKIYSFL